MRAAHFIYCAKFKFKVWKRQAPNYHNSNVQIYIKSNSKVGKNLLVNRFKNLNNKIEFAWLNDSFESYKIKCKNLFL